MELRICVVSVQPTRTRRARSSSIFTIYTSNLSKIRADQLYKYQNKDHKFQNLSAKPLQSYCYSYFWFWSLSLLCPVHSSPIFRWENIRYHSHHFYKLLKVKPHEPKNSTMIVFLDFFASRSHISSKCQNVSNSPSIHFYLSTFTCSVWKTKR